MIHEHSAGSIIYRIKDNKVEFLVVESVLHHTWGFPKGHLEPGETEQEAAQREVFEEVGLKPKFDFNFRRENEYRTEENTLKKVGFFLSKFDEKQAVQNQKEEILNSKWVHLAEAKSILPAGRHLYEMLVDATAYLEKEGRNF